MAMLGRSVSRQVLRDSLWNFSGLGATAVLGLTANLLIAGYYGPAALGVFNQVLAIYVVGGQFAALGVHLWAQREAALIDPGTEGARVGLARLASGAILAVAITSSFALLLGWLIQPLLATAFGSEPLGAAWLLALPGLAFFGLNKVLLAFAAGLGRLRLYALGQTGRPALFLLALGGWVALGLPGEQIAAALMLAEAALSMGLLAALLPVLRPWRSRVSGESVAAAARFGLRAFPGMAFADLNTRVDVLVLGVFASDAEVGIYSIASLFAEGILQIPVVMRVLINPRLARALAAGDADGVARLASKTGLASLLLVVSAFVMVAIILHPVSTYVLREPEYTRALVPLLALGLGISIASWRLPMDQLLVQAGHPGAHSTLKGATLAVNIMLCLALVPMLGMVGAGLGYGLSFVVYILLLRALARRQLGVDV